MKLHGTELVFTSPDNRVNRFTLDINTLHCTDENVAACEFEASHPDWIREIIEF